jgi:chloramphenicol-sensitive protein RarD
VAFRRVLLIYTFAAGLLAVNWLTYVWAVNAGFIIETSLGYFINPLLSVLLGVAFLGERLRLWQWLSVGLAALGVLYLTLTYGSLPWIALTLAFTFSLYGLIKKTAPLGSINGLTLETSLLFLPALFYLLYAESTGQGAFTHTGLGMDILMVGAGLVTTVPLLLFASAAQRIPLLLVGLFQYITPTLQFLIGVLIYREPFTLYRSLGFGIVWVALAVFALEGFLARRPPVTGQAAAGGQ